MNRNEIEKRAESILKNFGEKQIMVAIEEMAELTQALTKYMRVKNGGQPVRKTFGEVIQNITEELADVKLMIKQMQILFDVSDELLDVVIEEKIQRTLMECEENA